jgi:hypothetical protein
MACLLELCADAKGAAPVEAATLDICSPLAIGVAVTVESVGDPLGAPLAAPPAARFSACVLPFAAEAA